MSNSQVYTVGSTLRMADNDGFSVCVMVDGQWFAGEIEGMDGDGVLLRSDEEGRTMVRLAAISVVRNGPPVAARAGVAPVVALPVAMPEPVAAAADEPAEAADAATPITEAEAPEPPANLVVNEILSGVALAKLPASELLPDLPDDLTEAERQAVLLRRAQQQPEVPAEEALPEVTLHAVPDLAAADLAGPDTASPALLAEPVVGPALTPGQQVEEFALAEEAAPLTAPQVAAEPVTAEPASEESVVTEPVVEPVVESVVSVDAVADLVAAPEDASAEDASAEAMQSETQSDDWRAMLISLRQQAQAPIAEPAEKKKWRMAR